MTEIFLNIMFILFILFMAVVAGLLIHAWDVSRASAQREVELEEWALAPLTEKKEDTPDGPSV